MEEKPSTIQGGIEKKHSSKIFSSKIWIDSDPVGKIAASESTPLKFNMEPKKHPTEKENHLPNLHVQVPC